MILLTKEPYNLIEIVRYLCTTKYFKKYQRLLFYGLYVPILDETLYIVTKCTVKWPEMLLKAFSYNLDIFFLFLPLQSLHSKLNNQNRHKSHFKIFLFFSKIVTFHGRSSTYDLIQTVEWKQYFQCTVVRLLREKSDKIFPIDRNE